MKWGGMGVFAQTFLSEAQAVARAHVVARGGNAACSFRFDKQQILENVVKSQGYCLLCLSADIVLVRYENGFRHGVDLYQWKQNF